MGGGYLEEAGVQVTCGPSTQSLLALYVLCASCTRNGCHNTRTPLVHPCCPLQILGALLSAGYQLPPGVLLESTRQGRGESSFPVRTDPWVRNTVVLPEFSWTSCLVSQIHTQTDTKAHRQTLRLTDTQTHRHTDTQTHRHTDTQTHRHTDTPTHGCGDARTRWRRYLTLALWSCRWRWH